MDLNSHETFQIACDPLASLPGLTYTHLTVLMQETLRFTLTFDS
jgi:hypothetical protein